MTEIEIPDIKAKEFFENLFDMNWMSEQEKKTIYDAAELYAQGRINYYKASNTVSPVDNIVESEEKYLNHNGERYLSENYVIKEFMPSFLRKMLIDGRIKIAEGNKDYFSKILDEPTDIFKDFIPEEQTKEVSTNLK